MIQPGDTISAEVKYLGNNTYQLRLDDLNDTSPQFTIQIESSKPIRSSAEWIEESTGRLADFNTVTFTKASATATEPTGAITGPISDPAWQTDQNSGEQIGRRYSRPHPALKWRQQFQHQLSGQQQQCRNFERRRAFGQYGFVRRCWATFFP